MAERLELAEWGLIVSLLVYLIDGEDVGVPENARRWLNKELTAILDRAMKEMQKEGNRKLKEFAKEIATKAVDSGLS